MSRILVPAETGRLQISRPGQATRLPLVRVTEDETTANDAFPITTISFPVVTLCIMPDDSVGELKLKVLSRVAIVYRV
jgi:hypothetical protein